MAPENNEYGSREPDKLPAPDLRQALAALSNPELLSTLDLTLLELEKRLMRYAHIGPELLEMADEGLVLAIRARARGCYELAQKWLTNAEYWRPTENRIYRGIRIPMRFFIRVHNTL